MACSALGTFSRFAAHGGSSPRTFGVGSENYSILYEDIKSRRILQGNTGITGTRSRWAGKVRTHSYLVSGRVAMQVSPKELTAWLPRIFGGAISGTDVPLADTLPEFDLLIDRESDIYKYVDCQVVNAIIRGSSSEGGEKEDLIELIMTIVGKSETNGQSWSGSIPALTVDANDAPYGFWEGVLTVDSAALPMDQFVLSVDNGLAVRFRNSLTPTCIRATDRIVKLAAQMPFTTTSHAKALASNTAAVTGSLVFTNAGMSTSFAFAALRNIYTTPTIPGRSEIPLQAEFEAYRTVSTAEVVITHDATA